MSKNDKSQDLIDKIYLHQSLFYKDGERSELLVYLETEVGKSAIGADQYRHGVARDEYNCENELAEMFDQALKATRKVSFDKVSFDDGENVAFAKEKIDYYIEAQPYANVDKNKLNETLKAFSENRIKVEEAFTAQCVWGNAMRAISMQYASPRHYNAKAMGLYTDYLTELVKARVKGENLDAVPVPNDKLSFLDKISGKSYTWGVETLKGELRVLTDAQAKKLASQVEAGFPSKETCEFYSEKYRDEAVEYRRQYPSEKQDEMRQDVLDALTMRAVADALEGKYYDKTGDISIFMDKDEKDKFEKMSFKEMVEEYGLQLLKTHKGATMVELKLAEAKAKNGQALGEALDNLIELFEEKRKSYFCPDVSDEVQYRLLKGLKSSYQKFGTEDEKFRIIFEAMLIDDQFRQDDLADRVDTYKNALEGNGDRKGEYLIKYYGKNEIAKRYDRLRAKQLKQKKFFVELKELAFGKIDTSQIKMTLKARKAAKAKEMVENTGFAANTVLAEHAMEGYSFSKKAVESEKNKISEKRKVSLDKMKERAKEKGK